MVKEKVREKWKFFKVRGLSGNFDISFSQKLRKSQGILKDSFMNCKRYQE